MMAACPALRTLDLRCCHGDGSFLYGRGIAWSGNLSRVAMVGCEEMTLDLGRARSLRSFRFSGNFLNTPFYLPADLADLCIFLGDSISRSCFPNGLPNLTVLTISDNALRAVTSLFNDGANAQLPKLSDLQSLRELQLLMFKMEIVNLTDIYVCMKTFQLPNLERLFVKFPKTRYWTGKGPHDEVWEEPPKDGLDSLKIVAMFS
ncbi:hypothetical protein ACP4OV_031661 [Aristida adscensionis]